MIWLPIITLAIPEYSSSGTTLEISGDGQITNADITTKAPYTIIVKCIVNTGITSIAANSFKGCGKLSEISLPSSLKTIANGAFQGTKLTELTIPSSVTSYDQRFTVYQTNLERFYVASGNTKYCTYDDCLYNSDRTILYSVPPAKTSIEYPPEVKDLAEFSMYSLSIVNLTIPDSVEKINYMTFTDPGKSKYITFGIGSKLTLIPSKSFYNSVFETLWIPPKVTTIQDTGFYRTESKYVKFLSGSTLSNLEGNCFATCFRLISIDLPPSVTTISSTAFLGCSKLERVTFSEGSTNFGVSDDGILYSAQYRQMLFIPPQATSITVKSECQVIAYSLTQKLTNVPIDSVTLESTEYMQYENGVFYNKDFSIAQHGLGSLVHAVINSKTHSLTENIFQEMTMLQSLSFAEGSICKSLGNYICSMCTSLTSISLPSTIQNIPFYGFDSTKISEFVIPRDTEYVDTKAFQSVKTLTKVTFEEGCILNSIKSEAFHQSGILTFEFPPSLKIIGKNAFYNVPLQSIVIPDSVNQIDIGAFMSTSITNAIFTEHSKLTEIQADTFKSCKSLTTVTIPPSVAAIHGGCFSECTSLVNVTFLPYSVLTSLPALTFSGCSALKSLEMPSNISDINALTFKECFAFTTITVMSDSPFIFVDGFLYSKNGEQLYLFVPGLIYGKVSDSCVNIRSNAFACDSKLSKLEFGTESKVSSLGEDTFFECTGLKDLRLPRYISEISTGCFRSCTGLVYLEFAEGSVLSTLGARVFGGCNKLETVNFGADSNLKEIGEEAFKECISLKNISIPGTVSTIGVSAFEKCSALKLLDFIHTENGKLLTIPTKCFSGCSSLAKLTIPECVETIGEYSFADCSSLNHVKFGSKLAEVKERAFTGCNIDVIALGSSLKNIGEQAFAMNAQLTTVVTNASSLVLGSKAFAYCSSLRNFISCATTKVSGTDIFTGTNVIYVETVKEYTASIFAEKPAEKIMDGCLVFPTSIFTGNLGMDAGHVILLAQCLLSSEWGKNEVL